MGNGQRKQLGAADIKNRLRVRAVPGDAFKDKGKLSLACITDGSEPSDGISRVPDDTQTASRKRSGNSPFFDRQPRAQPPGAPHAEPPWNFHFGFSICG